jgi:hypothetical protein
VRSHATRIVLAGLLAVIAALGVFRSPESASWAAAGDVMFYLGSAETLAHGGGLRAPMGPWEGSAADSLTVPAHYPPGFSIAIAAVIRLGATPEHAARIVRGVSLGLTVALATLLVGAVAGTAAGVLAGLLIMWSPFVVFTHTIIFSEPLFTVFLVATIGLMVIRADRPIEYGVAAALGLGVRLIGVALTGAATLWAFAQPGKLGARVSRAAIAFVPSVIVEGIWQTYVRANHAADARVFGWYGPALPLFRRLIGVNLWWFWPTPASVTGAWVGVLKIVLLVAFIAVTWAAWRRGDARPRRLLAATALIVVTYNVVYIVDRLVMDWPNDFELRNFSVVDVMLALALATSVGVWWRGQRSVAKAGAVAGLAAWFVAATLGSATFLLDASREMVMWRAADRVSPLLSWVRADPNHREIYTNHNARVWRATDRRTRTLPLIYNRDTIAALGAALARTHGVLIGWPSRVPQFSLRPEQMAQYASPDTIAATLHLPVLVRSREGTVWGPPSTP